MFSIRSIARRAPRAATRLTSAALRKPARQTSLLPASFIPARSQIASAFSTSTIRREKEGEVDEELIAKVASEIELEQELRDDDVPTSVKEYLENGPFQLIDTPGQEEVALIRQYGDEHIRVTFSIADLNAIDPEADYADRALADEDDIDNDNINQGDKNFKVSPEDSIAPADTEEEGIEEPQESFPARVNIVVEKRGKGALAVETVAQDGQIIIDNVFYYPDAAHAYAKTPQHVHERQDLYVGPPFGNLDEDLQVLLERYLDERGINTALALFVPDYIDLKEQKEYLRWLENVKAFVEA